MSKKIKIFVGVFLVLAGVCYFLYPNFREWRTKRQVDTIIAEFEDNRDKAIAKAKESIDASSYGQSSDKPDSHESIVSDSSSDIQVVSPEIMKQMVMPDFYNALEQYNQNLVSSGQEIVDAWDYEQSPVDVNLLNDGSSVIGYIEIPDMKVKLPLYLGASSDNLKHGAAVLSQTSMPIGGVDTNCVIAGHRGYRGSAFFQHIDNMHEGSLVYIINPWETLTYRVVSAKIVSPNQTNDVMIQRGKDMVTLVSCHPYVVGGGSERYLVFCERVSDNPLEIQEVSTKQISQETVESEHIESDTKEQLETEIVETESSEILETFETLQSESESNSDFTSENELQRWESLLRILAPMTIIMFVCIIIFGRVKKRNS